jgi:hypothetical protein
VNYKYCTQLQVYQKKTLLCCSENLEEIYYCIQLAHWANMKSGDGLPELGHIEEVA